MEEDNKEHNKKIQTNYNSKEGSNNIVTPCAIPFNLAYTTQNNYSYIYPFNYNQPISIQHIPNNINNPFIYTNYFPMTNNSQTPFNVNQNNNVNSKPIKNHKVRINNNN